MKEIKIPLPHVIVGAVLLVWVAVMWNIALRNNNMLLLEDNRDLAQELNATRECLADLNASIVQGTCLLKLEEWK